MKKLNKLVIKPEKLMKNDELITLKGGVNCTCYHGQNGEGGVCLTGTASSASECTEMCSAIGCYGSYSGGGY